MKTNRMKTIQRSILVMTAALALAAGTAGSETPAPTAAAAPAATTTPAPAKLFVDTSALKPAGDFKLVDLAGNPKTMADYKGKVIILDFWATWCGPCKMEIPHFIDLYKEYQDDGLEILGVSLDNVGVKAVDSFAVKNKINYPILMGNNDIVAAYGGVKGIPTAFVITQDGKIYRKYIGYRERKVFESDIRALLGMTAAG